jgi:hypothetical protein
MILFLDIDGVLHPDPAKAVDAFCRRYLLWKMLVARPQLRVVISSDWRLHHPLPELAAWITKGGGEALAPRIVGVTPVLQGTRHGYRGREKECLVWLEENASESWLALDDVASNFTFGTSHLCLIDYRTGLIEADVETLLARVPLEPCQE